MTQLPAYGARLRIEVWKPGDREQPSYIHSFGSAATFKTRTTFACTYRIYIAPRQFKAISPAAFPGFLSWKINRGGNDWASDNPTGFLGKEKIGIPEDCFGVPGYRLEPTAYLYDSSKVKDLNEPFPLLHMVICDGAFSIRETPEATRKAYPDYVHIVGWFEPVLQRHVSGLDPVPKSESSNSGNEDPATGVLPNGSAMPAWSLSTTAGSKLRSADLSGKVCVVNFWATWCLKCVAEMPDFAALQEKFSGRVQFVGISIDEGVEKPDLDRFVKWKFQRQPLNYPVGIAAPAIRRDFGPLGAVPVTYVVNREGKIVSGHLGIVPKETLESEIEAALRGGQ